MFNYIWNAIELLFLMLQFFILLNFQFMFLWLKINKQLLYLFYNIECAKERNVSYIKKNEILINIFWKHKNIQFPADLISVTNSLCDYFTFNISIIFSETFRTLVFRAFSNAYNSGFIICRTHHLFNYSSFSNSKCVGF